MTGEEIRAARAVAYAALQHLADALRDFDSGDVERAERSLLAAGATLAPVVADLEREGSP